MPLLEAEVLKRSLLRLSKLGCTVFRQNTGQAWNGRKVSVRGRDVFIEGAQPITMGLVKGSSDVIGWTPVVVTEGMVGQKVAIFTAVEVKREVGGKTSPEQKNFLDRVRQAGGIAGVANSEDAAADVIERHFRSLL